MLKNLTKGKMVEYIILLIALVALGLSIAAVSTGCVSHFAGTCQDPPDGDGTCPIGVKGKGCDTIYDCISPKHPYADMDCYCDSSGDHSCCNGDPNDCRSGYKCVPAPKGSHCFQKHRNKFVCVKGDPGKCKKNGEECTPSVDICCDNDLACVEGEDGYRCNTKTTPPVKCATYLDPPINGKCCEGLTPGPNPYHPSSLACLHKSGIITTKCEQPISECDRDGKDCHCEGKKGICQGGGYGMLGMCVPHHNSKTKTQHHSNLIKKPVPDPKKPVPVFPACPAGQTFCKPLNKCLDERDNSCVSPDTKKHNNLPLIIGSSVGGFLLLLILIFLLMRK